MYRPSLFAAALVSGLSFSSVALETDALDASVSGPANGTNVEPSAAVQKQAAQSQTEGRSVGPASQFVTKGFVNIRQGPGTSFPLLTVIPPATPVNVDHCLTSPSAGWCQVSYDGRTGFVRSSLLEILTAGRPGTAKPKFLVQAEKNYNQAQNAVKIEQEKINRLLQSEAQLSQAAIAQTGSWFEPQKLWQKKRAAEQKLRFAQEVERQARAALDNAEDQARSIWEAKWSSSHQPMRPSWWQWW